MTVAKYAYLGKARVFLGTTEFFEVQKLQIPAAVRAAQERNDISNWSSTVKEYIKAELADAPEFPEVEFMYPYTPVAGAAYITQPAASDKLIIWLTDLALAIEFTNIVIVEDSPCDDPQRNKANMRRIRLRIEEDISGKQWASKTSS